MQLDVLPSDPTSSDPWYAGGLQFTCSQCGNCCTGGPGYVWISPEEIVRLADFLKLPPDDVVERYCRKIDGRFSLKERRTRQGLYDCVFLKEVNPQSASPSSDAGAGVSPRKACAIYSVRPLQCRTWPFWKENLREPQTWERSSRRCHGMNSGRHFTIAEIHAVRDAADWPANPPTSKAGGAPPNAGDEAAHR